MNKFFKYINDEISYIKPNFINEERIIIGFSTRKNKNNYNFDLGYNTKESQKNREIFFKYFNINYDEVIGGEQIHSNKIEIITEKKKGIISKEDLIKGVDGFITNKKEIPLSIRTADCIPVVIFDDDYNILSLLHCGWRSIVKDIFNQAVNILINKFNIKTEKLKIILGAGICQNCFEVNEDVFLIFKNKFNNYEEFSQEIGKKYYIDLKKIIIREAERLNIKSENIFNLNICTKEDELFFSYRRDKKVQSLITFGMLK
ncbi:MAG TPA: polyphenol oxidase family protein [bacterium]|nr:polyphenol oxidase family protein [bacterium]HOL47571.1 polyphenol oxidase family protein [bacterium]HPQ18833.1 polyphenol oxidase family protein [bacterium]